MTINAYQVEYHVNRKELKDLAAFCYFKFLYKNGCIYNYNSQKLSYKSKYSASFIRKMMKRFLDKGWCRMHGNNLIFNKLKSFNGSEAQVEVKDKINIKGKTIKEIISFLELQIIRLHDSRFSRIKKLKRDLVSNKAKIRHRAEDYAESIGIRTDEQIAKLPNETDKLILCNKKLSRVLNCSSGKASNVVKKLERMGLIEVERKTEKGWVPNKVTPEHMKHLKEMGVSFGMGNWIFKVSPLKFTIC